VISDPLYIGDDHKNPGKIELISRIPAANSFVLVSVEVQRDERGRYNVCSFYTMKKQRVEHRRDKGFLKIATKTKRPR
jgi:hypothetical protein